LPDQHDRQGLAGNSSQRHHRFLYPFSIGFRHSRPRERGEHGNPGSRWTTGYPLSRVWRTESFL